MRLGLRGWLFGCLLVSASTQAQEPLSITGPTMGTAYRITVADPPQDYTAGKLRLQVEAYLMAFDELASTYRPDSEISRFNQASSVAWFPVSQETAALVQAALDAAEQSGGAFDPTVGPLVRLWGFDRRQGRQTIPTDAELQSIRNRIGYTQVETRLDPPALRKARPDVEIDINGIAPGFAADRLAELLAEQGMARFLVDVGGEIAIRGQKSDETSWRIGVERPLSGKPRREARELIAAIPLADCGVTTSGDYRNFYEIDGKRYSHTLDPRTGSPVAHRITSVTVIAGNAATADAMATAITVLGPQEGIKLADRLHLAVWLMERSENDELASHYSRRFREEYQPRLIDLTPEKPVSDQPAATRPLPRH